MKRMRDLKLFVCVLLLMALVMPRWDRAQNEAKEPDTTTHAELNRLLEEATQAYYASDFPTVLHKCQTGLKLARSLDAKRYISLFLSNMGLMYWYLGQYQQSLTCNEQAIAIARESGYRYEEGIALRNTGLVFSNSQYQSALEYYEQALTIAHEFSNKYEEGNILGNIGAVYWKLGQYQQAIEYHQQALVVRREIDDLRGEGRDLINIGLVCWSLGQYQQALGYYKQALLLTREIGNTRGEVSALNAIGGMYHGLRQHQQALEFYEHALAIARKIGDLLAEERSLGAMGEVYLDLGQYQKASTTFQDSVNIHESLGKTDDLWFAQRGLAAVEVKLNQPASAITHYEQALDTIEQLRAGLTEKEYKLSFMQNKLYVYDELITLLQNLHQQHPDKGYDRKTLEIFERKQGRMFLEEMGQSGARNFAGIPAELLEKELDLENQLEQTRKQLVDQRSKPITEQNKELIQALEQREKTLQTEQTALQTQIKTNYPDYYALRYPKPVALADLQQLLQPGELLLIYHVMKDMVLLWVVGKDQFGLYPLAIDETTLTAKVEAYRKAITEPMLDAIARQETMPRLRRIAQRSIAEITGLSTELSDLLLPAVMRPALANAQTVYIVPTGILYGLPFEVLNSPLLVGEGSGVRFLIEDHAIAYLSSASLLNIVREAEQRRTGAAQYPLLAFANPVYQQPTHVDTEDTSLKGLTTRSYLNLLGGQFAELPETEAEVKEIQTVLNAPDDSQPLHLRENAARSTVFDLLKQDKLADYRYVVFSCHGVLPGEINQVTQPALVLSLPDPVTKSEDFLTMADVFGLQFQADLITLSACNTGRGQQVNGEGVVGLTRAFMYAGTPALSMTLWSVESQSAKLLSTGLYRGLQAGQSRAAALRESKLALLRGDADSLYQHPFFWAPVVLFGDGR